MIYEMVSDKKHRVLKEILLIAAGSIIIAFGISVFLVPNKLAAGGVSGIGVIIYNLTGGKISVGLTMLVLNVPLFFISLKKLGKYFIIKTIVGTVIVSVFTEYS